MFDKISWNLLKVTQAMLGERIRKLRRDRDWTQKELAERVGVDYKNISNYEVGRLTPSRKTLDRIADVFGIPVGELHSDRPQEPTLAIEDPELLSLFHEISTFSETERSHLKWMLSAVVKQKRLKEMMAS